MRHPVGAIVVIRHLLRNARGQSTLELALTLPILVLLVFGITDFGRMFYTYSALDHAGREAARAASLGAADSQVQTIALNAMPGLDPTKVVIAINPDASTRVSGNYVTVSLSYPVAILTPLMSSIISNPYLVTNQTVMRVE